jgi:hypothetical protein
MLGKPPRAWFTPAHMKTLSALAVLLLAAVVARADMTLQAGGGAFQFNSNNGALQVAQKATVLTSGEAGLWSAKFQDGRTLCANDFIAGSTSNSFACEPAADGRSVQLRYRSAALKVTVLATARADGIEFTAEVQPQGNSPLLDFALPARLRFDPAQVQRCIFPANGNHGVGLSLRRSFFERQSEEQPAAWRSQSVGGKAYKQLFGGNLVMRPMSDPPVPLIVTAAGRDWLGADFAKRLQGAVAVCNRPPGEKQADLVLVETQHGPWYYASRLGGTGHLWRVSGFVDSAQAGHVQRLVSMTMSKLARAAVAPRTKLAVLALAQGPAIGSGNSTRVSAWLEQFHKLRAVQDHKVTLVELTSPPELVAALAGGEYLAILNPYGESLPAASDQGLGETVAAIGRYVRNGGNWFEVGGYSFHGALRPVRYFKYSLTYPPAFADFLCVETVAGAVSVFGVQPMTNAAWAAAKNPETIFVPGTLGCGGDEHGGYADRVFNTFVKPGATWRAPAVRLTLGQTAGHDLQTYCADNRITRRLEAKMPPALLARFKQSVLVYYAGTCAEKIAHLDQLPAATLVHFADYLKGGFDKEYPDHLPPRAAFGTPQQFRQLFDACHAHGLLVMPYTNPTWWCDHPRGPTFLRDGEAPLLRKLDGSLSYERYHVNDGYTVCHWHPAVQNVNREVVRQFSEDYPVDVLFQDQTGARGWRYDLNPASPTPAAYIEGLLSQMMEDATRKPLSTEAGWDRTANFESQLCGLSFQIVPTEHAPDYLQLLKHVYPPQTWDIYPLAQEIAHDKAALLYHDLGQFVTNPELVAWTLGLGFGMSYRVAAKALDEPKPREWLRWLDRLQKSVCARYTGVPLRAFAHERPAPPIKNDDGLLRSAFGDVEIVANLGTQPRGSLAAFGFRVTAPGLVAGRLQKIGARDFGADGVSFVAEGDAKKMDLWVFATAGSEVALELPCAPNGDAKLKLAGGDAANVTLEKNIICFRLPDEATRKTTPWLWHATLAVP